MEECEDQILWEVRNHSVCHGDANHLFTEDMAVVLVLEFIQKMVTLLYESDTRQA